MRTLDRGVTTYRLQRKPVTVQAVPFNGSNWAEILAFTGAGLFMQVAPRHVPGDGTIVAEVYSLLHCEWVGVRVGQWIVRGVLGELYPVFDQVARAGYEEPEGGWPE
jgi:hypothetical protein